MREVQLWESREIVLCCFGGNWCSAVQVSVFRQWLLNVRNTVFIVFTMPMTGASFANSSLFSRQDKGQANNILFKESVTWHEIWSSPLTTGKSPL